MTRCKTFGAAAALSLAAVFLIPIVASAAQKGSQRARLGVAVEDVGPDDVARLRLPGERGAIVSSVRPDTPAAGAGLQAGDVIVRFQGETVQSAAQLTRLVAETPAGRRVEIEVRRDGAERVLQATLEGRGRASAGGLEPPEPPTHPELPSVPGLDVEDLAGKARALVRSHGYHAEGPPRLGITFQRISGQLARYFKLPGEEGLLVSSVREGSPAAEAGIRAGDVILQVGGREVRDAGALREEVGRADAGEALDVTVQRDGTALALVVRLRGSQPTS